MHLSSHWGPEDPSGVQSSLCVSLSFHLSICPSVHLSIYPSVHQSICPAVPLSICPYVCLSVCLSVSLSGLPRRFLAIDYSGGEGGGGGGYIQRARYFALRNQITIMCLSIFTSVRMFVYLSVSLSLCQVLRVAFWYQFSCYIKYLPI